MTKSNLEYLAEIAKATRKRGEEAIARFKEKLEVNPRYAFEWSSSAFVGAAEIEVAAIIEECLADKEPSFDSIMTDMKNRVFRAARYPARSTSVPSNEMEACVGAAWAEVVECFRFRN